MKEVGLKKAATLFLGLTFLFGSVPAASAAVEAKNQTAYQKLKTRMYQHLTNRETRFEIVVMGPGRMNKTEALVEQALDEIYKADEYLYYSMKGYKVSAKVGRDRTTLLFTMEYLATRQQEAYVAEQVKKISAKIIMPTMNAHEKVRIIHDYIVANVAYDESLTRYSAYDALTSGKTVCNGYALLASKLLKQAGIENRIISGYASDGEGEAELHAWNLVKLDGKWYHVDCTWDDPVPDQKGRVLYAYYNLSDEQIKKDHYWTGTYPRASTLYPQALALLKNQDKKRAVFYSDIEMRVQSDARFRPTVPYMDW